jgi:hypothetical protein
MRRGNVNLNASRKTFKNIYARFHTFHRMGASQERAVFFEATWLVVTRHRGCVRNTGGPPGRRKIHPALPLRDLFRGVYRVGRNLVLYQAWGAHRRQFIRGLPFRNKADGGKRSLIWTQKIRIRPQCRVTTLLWAPGADSGQREKKRNRVLNSDRKMTAVRDPGVAGR